MGPKVEAACRFVEATGGRAAIGSLTQIQQIVDGEVGTQVVPGTEEAMTFGVHSEVGRLRKVMVHRPELSLQRLTPTNHDDLLFDDVLWVERAQYEHDQFVARMRERGVEVFLLQDLLGEALAASDEGRQRLIEVTASEFTVGVSMVDEVRAVLVGDGARHSSPPTSSAASRSPSPASTSAACAPASVIAAAVDDESMFVLPPLPNTLFTRDSSCWMYGGVSINPMYWPARRLEAYNVAAIYRYHPMFAEADFEYWYPELGDEGRFDVQDFGRASLEGGDVQPIGNGTVLIGMSERSQARMIEQVARSLFAKGGAERVIAVVMTKDRAHMHLDTVFTMLDRDAVTVYPRVMDQVRAISLRPGVNGAGVPRHRGEGLPARGRRRARRTEAAGDRDRRRRLPAGARAVGRRQQRRRPGAGRGRRLRAQHPHDREDARGRHRGDHHRGLRARQGPRRRPLHDLPAGAGPAVSTPARWVIVGGRRSCWSWRCSIWARGDEHHRGDDVGSSRSVVAG